MMPRAGVANGAGARPPARTQGTGQQEHAGTHALLAGARCRGTHRLCVPGHVLLRVLQHPLQAVAVLQEVVPERVGRDLRRQRRWWRCVCGDKTHAVRRGRCSVRQCPRPGPGSGKRVPCRRAQRRGGREATQAEGRTPQPKPAPESAASRHVVVAWGSDACSACCAGCLLPEEQQNTAGQHARFGHGPAAAHKRCQALPDDCHRLAGYESKGRKHQNDAKFATTHRPNMDKLPSTHPPPHPTNNCCLPAPTPSLTPARGPGANSARTLRFSVAFLQACRQAGRRPARVERG